MLDKSCCRALASAIESTLLYSLLLSANQAMVDEVATSGKSLTNKRNNIGLTDIDPELYVGSYN